MATLARELLNDNVMNNATASAPALRLSLSDWDEVDEGMPTKVDTLPKPPGFDRPSDVREIAASRPISALARTAGPPPAPPTPVWEVDPIDLAIMAAPAIPRQSQPRVDIFVPPPPSSLMALLEPAAPVSSPRLSLIVPPPVPTMADVPVISRPSDWLRRCAYFVILVAGDAFAWTRTYAVATWARATARADGQFGHFRDRTVRGK